MFVHSPRRIGVFLFAAMATAACTRLAAQDEKSKRRVRCDFLGTVASIDLRTGTIVVRGSKKDGSRRHVVRFDADTEIVKSREPFDPARIRPDMRIWVYLRKNDRGEKLDLARRLTISDPYPDLYGRIESINPRDGTLVVSHLYPGSKSGDRQRHVTLRASEQTRITMGGRAVRLADVPVGRRVAITRARDDENRLTDVIARMSVWREEKPREKRRGSDDDDRPP